MLLRDSLVIQCSILGKQHKDVGMTLATLANVLNSRRRFPGAAIAYCSVLCLLC